jgi:hypothetical protein
VIIGLILQGFLGVAAAIIGFLPEWDVQVPEDAAVQVGLMSATLDQFVPVSWLLTTIGIILAVEVFALVWDFIWGVYERVPAKST